MVFHDARKLPNDRRVAHLHHIKDRRINHDCVRGTRHIRQIANHPPSSCPATNMKRGELAGNERLKSKAFNERATFLHGNQTLRPKTQNIEESLHDGMEGKLVV